MVTEQDYFFRAQARLIFSIGYSLFGYGIVSFCDLRSCQYRFRTNTIITAEIALEKGKGTAIALEMQPLSQMLLKLP